MSNPQSAKPSLINISAKAPTQVAILGGSGLVGRALITTLLADPDIREIHLLLRRPLADLPTDARLHQHQTDFAKPDSWQKWLAVDTVFCSLGTTIKHAGSQAAFRVVDLDLVGAAANHAKQAGAKHFLAVSALGANARSGIFYNRIKGEMEAALTQLNMTRLSIFRPSLLTGKRPEFRLGERIAMLLGGVLPLAWRPIAADLVAHAMWLASREQHEAFRCYESGEMQRMALKK